MRKNIFSNKSLNVIRATFSTQPSIESELASFTYFIQSINNKSYQSFLILSPSINTPSDSLSQMQGSPLEPAHLGKNMLMYKTIPIKIYEKVFISSRG